MLTLKELKKIVKVADVEKRIPSVKSLKEHKVVVKETYMIKKGRLSLNLRPPYSKDRIHKATERIIEEQKEQSKDS